MLWRYSQKLPLHQKFQKQEPIEMEMSITTLLPNHMLALPIGNFDRNCLLLLVSPKTNSGGSDTTVNIFPLYSAAIKIFLALKLSGYVYRVYK